MSYFVCDSCTSKWFQDGELRQCPRCGDISAGEKIEAPWRTWSYDPNNRSTGDGHDLIARTELEEAIGRLRAAGIKNQFLLLDILKALSGLSGGEVRFTVELCLERESL